jgi:hypothetical protein
MKVNSWQASPSLTPLAVDPVERLTLPKLELPLEKADSSADRPLEVELPVDPDPKLGIRELREPKPLEVELPEPRLEKADSRLERPPEVEELPLLPLKADSRAPRPLLEPN